MNRPNRYGNGVLYLFNRPPDKAAAEDPKSYRIRSTFSGLDTAGQPASGTSEKVGTGAWVQDDGRTVAVGGGCGSATGVPAPDGPSGTLRPAGKPSLRLGVSAVLARRAAEALGLARISHLRYVKGLPSVV